MPQRGPSTKRNGHRRLSYMKAPRLRPLLKPPNNGTQMENKLDLRMALKKGAGQFFGIFETAFTSNTKRSTCTPTATARQHGTVDADIWHFTPTGDHIHYWAGKRPIKHIPTRRHQSLRRHNRVGNPPRKGLEAVQTNLTTSLEHARIISFVEFYDEKSELISVTPVTPSNATTISESSRPSVLSPANTYRFPLCSKPPY